MQFLTLFFIALGLSGDAFAVAVTQGLAMAKVKFKDAARVGFYFGAFQMLMPIMGFYLGSSFKAHIEQYDHFIACGLLSIIGINMIVGALKSKKDNDVISNQDTNADSYVRTSRGHMLLLALATSIDALIVGVSVAMISDKILFQAIAIGITTFSLSLAGVYIGNRLGVVFKQKAEIFGGVILILIGVKVLFEHLMPVS